MQKRYSLFISLAVAFIVIPNLLSGQLYTPGGTIQGSSNNDWIGLDVNEPEAQLHIWNREDIALLLDVGGQAALGEGEGYEYTAYPIEMRFTDPQLETQSVRFRMHNSGLLDVGTDFSNHETFGSNRLNLDGSMQIFATPSTYSFLNEQRLRWSGIDQFHFSYYDPVQESDLAILTLDAQGPSYLDGALGINTSQTPPGYKLYVGGKVLCEELTVKLEQEWPDYVFEEDHERMSLQAIKSYIDEHGRLPGMPGAEEVAEEGVDVGQLNALLLEKVEELTLEMIEMQEEIRELKEAQ